MLWTSVRTGLVHLDLAKEGEQATSELALATFLEFGLKWAKGLDRPPPFALCSREEAAYVAETLADAFAATDGALEWLATQARRSSSHPGRGRRGR